jgi:hypothetical protein
MRPSFIIAASFIFLGVMILNFTGFCYPKLRYCSDQELIDAAVRRTLDWRQNDPTVVSPITYSSLQEFYTKNPKCCALYRWDSDREEIWSRIFGFYVARVEISYRRSDNDKEPYFYAEVSVSACGGIRHIRGIPEASR